MTTAPDSPSFGFEAVPTITSDRIVLREVDPEADLDRLFALFSDPAVARFTDTATFDSIEDAVGVMDWIAGIFAERRGFRWAIALTANPDQLIGTCGFNDWNRSNNSAEIGYDLMQRHWRTGIMTEAVGLMADFGFDQMFLNRIEAEVTDGNYASAAVLTKVGFNEEGLLRQHGFWSGTYHDIRLFGLLRSDWQWRRSP